MPKQCRHIWSTRCRHWRRVDPCATTKRLGQGRSETTSSPLHFPRRRRQRRYLQNKQKRSKQVFLYFQSGCSSFKSAKSGAGRVDSWIGIFPPPISFLQRWCCPPPPWLWDRCPSKLWFSAPSSLSSALPAHFLIVSVMSYWRREDAAVGLLMEVVTRPKDWCLLPSAGVSK